MTLSSLRRQIRLATHADETGAVATLLGARAPDDAARQQGLAEARRLVAECRGDSGHGGGLDAFLREFGLSSPEGVALMCLAEALLRVPDEETSDRLIAEKIRGGDWRSHLGQTDSLFVNASTWGLMLTGRVVTLDPALTGAPVSWLEQLTGRLGEPLVRRAVRRAMAIMGGEFVLGRTIDEGVRRGRRQNPPGTLFSFDMLGEGARTDVDARAYFESYREALDRVAILAGSGKDRPIERADGISVKLSALHPRYEFAQYDRVLNELLPRLRTLCLRARAHNLGLSIDAEEAVRLDLNLSLFEALARDPALAGWQGLGFVLQAYQKRAPGVADWLIALARQTGRRFMVRLVKGAYWDAEIKRAQQQGLDDYPVFTRKANTDLCYLVCAARLLEATDAVYPQFGSHNAYTLAMVRAMAGDRPHEFQRLHGMGALLYEHFYRDAGENAPPLRVYAPIGQHRDLLPYLVRRLLENGANSSFVNRFLDDELPVDALVRDVIGQVEESASRRHGSIPPPLAIYRNAGEERAQARGLDLDAPLPVAGLMAELDRLRHPLEAVADGLSADGKQAQGRTIRDPATGDTVGRVVESSTASLDAALAVAARAQPEWNRRGGEYRAHILEAMADVLEAHTRELIGIIGREGGRTLKDGLSEVREAVDFCRYYALQARSHFGVGALLHGRGVFFCISPWNFPLAIFTGQIAGALAAGNTVLAKPAEQTPLVAARAVDLFREAGLPREVVQLVPGDGPRIGEQLIPDARLAGVAFTGSTATAGRINRLLARRQDAIPLIAETGGQNAMVVDSSALHEQLVDDIVASAFHSAGQRCSALRVLYLQEEIADDVLAMLRGAMAELRLGNPLHPATDVGPVIDGDARAALEAHVRAMYREARIVAACEPPHSDQGHFVAPRVFEIEHIDQLPGEVFGPVLHVIRYRLSELDSVIEQIEGTGYGLTLGVHSRVEAFADHVFRHTRAGNTYINRNMVGAVVGVNPFGGTGLSGTGPKAGGPHYVPAFARPLSMPETAAGAGTVRSDTGKAMAPVDFSTVVRAWRQWREIPPPDRCDRVGVAFERLSGAAGAVDEDNAELRGQILADARRLLKPVSLPGPTGEDNRLSLHPRGVFLCLTEGPWSSTPLLVALAAGCGLVVATRQPVEDPVPVPVPVISALADAGVPDNLVAGVPWEQVTALLEHPQLAGVVATDLSSAPKQWARRRLADRHGAILPWIERLPAIWAPKRLAPVDYYLARFCYERTRTENLTARGGDTVLFSLRE